MLVGQQQTVAKAAYDSMYPEIRTRMEELLLLALDRRVAELGKEAKTPVATGAEEFEMKHYLWDEEKDEPLLDEEGQPIVDESVPPTPMVRMWAEVGVE